MYSQYSHKTTPHLCWAVFNPVLNQINVFNKVHSSKMSKNKKDFVLASVQCILADELKRAVH